MTNIKYFLLMLAIVLTLQSPQSFAAGGLFGGGSSSSAVGEEKEELKDIWVATFMLMAEQFTTIMLQQVEVIGTFFDAKHQLETQRLFQQKVAQAHKDYHPSEQLCEIGTFVRNLSKTEERIRISRNAIQNASIARALGSGDVKTMDDQGSGSDERTRRTAYIEKFCNIHDNSGQNNLLCETSKHVEQQNADINYTQTIDNPLTLDIDFTDPAVTKQEENIFAFLDQIFMNKAFPDMSREKTIRHDFIRPYQEMRSLIAMRSVAQNSFAHIIGEKTKGPPEEDGDITPFIRSLLGEIGLNAELIEGYIGKNPSYHAQMEILTKKMLQHPEFIANLYDKPTNVKRIRAALSAIKLMQDRDIHNAMQRRDMLTSMILELQVRHKQNRLSNEIEGVIANLPSQPPNAGNVPNAGTGAGF